MRISGIGCALPGTLLPYTIEITNLGGAASASGQLLVTLPDGTTATLVVPAIAPAASTTLKVGWSVPVITPKVAGESDAAYRARLATFDGRPLTLNASLSWNDAAANPYGTTTAQFLTLERLPILFITAGALTSAVAPAQSITATFTMPPRGIPPPAGLRTAGIGATCWGGFSAARSSHRRAWRVSPPRPPLYRW